MLNIMNGQDTMVTQGALNPVVPGLSVAKDDAIRILLAEDVQSDAMLTKIALDATNIPFSLSKVKKGNELVSMLRSGRMCTESLPDVIILDLGLPGMNGFEILDEMMDMPTSLRAIPIVILTSHENFEYIKEVYPLYILSYLTKPCDTHDIRDLLTKVRANRYRTHEYACA